MSKQRREEAKPFMYHDFQEAFKSLKGALTYTATYALLLGESGTGKTTLLRALAHTLDRQRFQVLYLCHGRLSASALIRLLADSLHLPIRRTRPETSRLLVQSIQNLPTRLLLWVDEAQLTPDETLHEIRLLSEAQLHRPPLFSVVLSALPALKERLLAPDLFPLWRRISPRLTLTSLRQEEISPFLAHVLGKRSLAHFSSQVLATIFEQARGVPGVLQDLAAECLKAHPAGKIGHEVVADVLDRMQTT